MSNRARQLTVNGVSHALEHPDHEPLIDTLRERLSLTGTHSGCDTAQCGACTVLINGRAVKSCNVLTLQVGEHAVTTIEGIGSPDALHLMQQLFSQHHALQCGYCTPGFIMRALAMVNEDVAAEPAAVRLALEGNLCRCTGYEGIVTAIVEGLAALRRLPQQSAQPSKAQSD